MSKEIHDPSPSRSFCPSGTNAGYEGLKNAFGIINENLLMNLSDTGISPAKLAVVCLIAAVLAVDIAVLWLISRNTIAEARTFFKDNFYFKRIKLVYPTPVPKQNTPKQKLKHLFHHIREEGKLKLQEAAAAGGGTGYGYGTTGYDDAYDTSATGADYVPHREHNEVFGTDYGAAAEHNELFGNVFESSTSFKEKDKKLFGGKLFSKPWSPVSGPSGPAKSSSSSSSFYPTSTAPPFLKPSDLDPVAKKKSVAEKAVDSVSKAGNHLFGNVMEKLR